MSGVDLIVAALAAGATTGIMDTTDGAVRDAYTGLRVLARRRLARSQQVEQVDEALNAHAADPEASRDRLIASLNSVAADQDAELVAASRRLLAQIDPSGPAGRYRIILDGGRGHQIGDSSTQTNYFGPVMNVAPASGSPSRPGAA